MPELLGALSNLAAAVVGVAAAVAVVAAPFVPILAWAAFWYFAVDWQKLRPLLARGGAVTILIVAAIAVAAGVAVDPEPSRTFGPVPVSSLVHKIGWVAALATVALLAGAARVSRGGRASLRVHG